MAAAAAAAAAAGKKTFSRTSSYVLFLLKTRNRDRSIIRSTSSSLIDRLVCTTFLA